MVYPRDSVYRKAAVAAEGMIPTLQKVLLAKREASTFKGGFGGRTEQIRSDTKDDGFGGRTDIIDTSDDDASRDEQSTIQDKEVVQDQEVVQEQEAVQDRRDTIRDMRVSRVKIRGGLG